MTLKIWLKGCENHSFILRDITEDDCEALMKGFDNPVPQVILIGSHENNAKVYIKNDCISAYSIEREELNSEDNA